MAAPAVPDMQVTVARTLAEVELLREAWEAAQPRVLDSQIDYFTTVAANAPWVVRPHVIRIRRNGRPDLFAIARIEDVPMRLRVGYRVVARPMIRAVVPTFGGLLGAESAADEALLLRELDRALTAREADAILLRQVPVDGSIADAVRGLAGAVRRTHGQPVTRRWVVDIGSSLDQVLASRSAKSRKKMRAADRKFERDHEGKVRVRLFRDPVDLDDLCRDLDRVSSLTYQRGLAVGFQASAFDRAMLGAQLRHGWHRTWMLYVDDVAVAFWTGTAYAGTFATGTPGFDPAWAKDSVGRYTMFAMIEDLCDDAAIERLDFGQGDADYKEAYASPAGQERDEIVLASRVRPVAVGLLTSASLTANAAARNLIGRTEWGARLKKAWRDRLSS